MGERGDNGLKEREGRWRGLVVELEGGGISAMTGVEGVLWKGWEVEWVVWGEGESGQLLPIV